ncbi:type IV pilus assembly protein PilM [Microcella putealis]|uniref:Type IV pilus assembly protein PilM n=1 Tax=Microcella putealis TaxID=337005 RepID=A0A4Q7LQM0_9MICO|nr:type IV pilus assembly protein PilM [Microcella putealis]RZS56452.1 type IV pilus assembly protein PilM [Microcella putealis]TQM27062.1 type IV pilus assembly protein PilM [Microcella putealis]
MAKTIVGVDIGATSIRAVEVAGAGTAKPTVLRYGSIELPDGAVKRGEVIEPNTVGNALKRLWSTTKFGTKSVVLGMGNQRVLARDLTVPQQPLALIRESLPFQIQDLLPMPVSEAVYDFYPLRAEQQDGKDVVHGILVAAVKETVMTNLSAARIAGLKPVGVDLIPFALTRLMSRTEAGSGRVVLLDIGADTTSFVVVDNGVPQFVRLIGMGGGDITRALVGRLGMTEPDAEAAKRALGLATEGVRDEHRPIVEVIYEVAGELITSVRNTITFVQNTHSVAPPERIVLSGKASALPGLARAIADYTRIPVAIAKPFDSIPIKTAAKKQDAVDHDTLQVALGLAIGAAA